MKTYARLDPSGVYMRAGHQNFAYSDGSEIESALCQKLQNCGDLSVHSVELARAIIDWPTEYHLSGTRTNLLRSLDIRPGHRVLELGSGFGAITRYLGELGAVVTAVEGSPERARGTAARCRDLLNVQVYCDNLSQFETNERFDIVTLIGVLEYAPLYIASDDPVRTCLQRAAEFLRDDGVLILAIENRLGLKYFAGCHEDHVGVPYFGINDLYTANTAITFGKAELTQRIKEGGFEYVEFFYPFPDYKLPTLILSDPGSRDPRLNVADMLIQRAGRDYHENYHRVFSEGLAWKTIADNRLLGDMANSFLICARKTCSTGFSVDWLAKIYSRTQRRSEFLVETTIEAERDGRLAVRKRRVASGQVRVPANDTFRHHARDSTYIIGRLLLTRIHQAVAREENLHVIAAQYAPWLAFLSRHAVAGEDGKLALPGDFIDCLPANIIVNEGGNLEYFDAEWICETAVPMSWVVIRGIAYSVAGCLSSRALIGMTYRQFIDGVLGRLGYSVNDDDYIEADRMERKFSLYCHLPTGPVSSLSDMMKMQLFMFTRLSEAPGLVWHKTELARVKSSVSWRITAPLRVVWNLYRKIADSIKIKFPKFRWSLPETASRTSCRRRRSENAGTTKRKP